MDMDACRYFSFCNYCIWKRKRSTLTCRWKFLRILSAICDSPIVDLSRKSVWFLGTVFIEKNSNFNRFERSLLIKKIFTYQIPNKFYAFDKEHGSSWWLIWEILCMKIVIRTCRMCQFTSWMGSLMTACFNLTWIPQDGGHHKINKTSQEIFGISFHYKWVYQKTKSSRTHF